MPRKEQCISCVNYDDEQRDNGKGAKIGTCRILSPAVGPMPFPEMPRNGWCRRYEAAPGTAGVEVLSVKIE